MAKIDIDKFVASLIKHYCEAHSIDRTFIRCWFDDALEEQGLEYKNGEIVKTQRRIAAEAKEALYTAKVDSEDKKMINALLEGFKYHQLFHPMFGGVPETEIIAWLEKQKDTNVLIQEASEKAYTEGMRVERKRWLEKQGKKKSIDDLTAQEAMDIAVEKCFEGGEKDPCEECSCAMLNCTHFPCDKKKEFDGEKPYSFKSIPRLLEMIEPSDRAKAYCKKLINSLNGGGVHCRRKSCWRMS